MHSGRMVLRLGWAAMVAVLTACGEAPQAPSDNTELRVPTVVRTTVPALCEKNWLYAEDGTWGDTYQWLPSGAPGPTDEVCISGPGTYTIELDGSFLADSIYIGPGVNLTLRPATPGIGYVLGVMEEVVVPPGASLTLTDDFFLSARDIINDGSLVVVDSSTIQANGVFENRGYLELESAPNTIVSDFRNSGDLLIAEDLTISLRESWEFVAGRVLGPGKLRLKTYSNYTPAVIWSGGQLGLRGASSNAASVTLEHVNLTLANTGLGGAIDMEVDHDTLFGDLGANVDVKLIADGYQMQVTLLPNSGTVYSNFGVLQATLHPNETDEGLRLIAPNTLDNRGELRGMDGVLDIDAAQFLNQGRLVVDDTLVLGAFRPMATTNRGSMEVRPGAVAELRDGVFTAEPAGSQTGRLRLTGGTLTGSGRVGDVRVDGGFVSPGPGIRTLTFDRLTLGPAATVKLEASGLSTFDRLRVDGEARYGGHLEIQSVGSFTSLAGSCGQVLPMFTDRNSQTGYAPGAFQTFAQVPAALGRFWRAHYGRDSVFVVGYDPTAWVTATSPSGALAEGGPSRHGQFCLNVPVTGADVTAQLTAARAQFTLASTALTFTSANFALPQPVQYTAVDDGASEGPHGDTLRVTLQRSGLPYGGTMPKPVFAITDNDPAVDLAVSMVSANNPVLAGQTIERRFRVTNVGPGASTGSTFSIPALTGVTFLANSTGASCAMNGSALQCAVGALASGAQYEFVVLFTAPAATGSYNNTLRVRGNDWDNVASNDSALWTLIVN